MRGLFVFMILASACCLASDECNIGSCVAGSACCTTVSGTSCSCGAAGCYQRYCGVPYVSGTGAATGVCKDTTHGQYSTTPYGGWPTTGSANSDCWNWTLPIGTTNPVNNGFVVIGVHGGGDEAYNSFDQTITAQGVSGTSWSSWVASKGGNFFYPLYSLAAAGYLNAMITSGATSIVICGRNSNFYPGLTGDEMTPFTEQIESELVRVTASTSTGGGCLSGGGTTFAQTVTRGYNSTTAAAHAINVATFVQDSIGDYTEVGDIRDVACAAAVIAANGWGNANDIRLIGWSHGCVITGQLATASTATKLAWLSNSATGWACPSQSTSWTITAVAAHSCPASQDAVSTISSDNSEPMGNWGEYGRSFGGANNNKVLISPGCSSSSTPTEECDPAAGGTTRMNPPGNTSWTSLATAMFDGSPINWLPNGALDTSNLPPQFIAITPNANHAPMGVVTCASDLNVGPAQEIFYAVLGGMPYISLAGGHLCDNQGLDIGTTSGLQLSKWLFINDNTYGITQGSSSPSGGSAAF
jgi:hypothetical protein